MASRNQTASERETGKPIQESSEAITPQEGSEERAIVGPRTAEPTSLLAGFRRVIEDMDRMFEPLWGGGGPKRSIGALGPFSPAIEVFTQDDEVCVRADLPGLRRQDIRAEVLDGQLVLSGERRSSEEKTERGVVRSERRYGAFRRVVPLPEGTDAESARATFHDGVLEIRLKHYGRKGRSISIDESTNGDDGESHSSVH